EQARVRAAPVRGWRFARHNLTVRRPSRARPRELFSACAPGGRCQSPQPTTSRTPAALLAILPQVTALRRNESGIVSSGLKMDDLNGSTRVYSSVAEQIFVGDGQCFVPSSPKLPNVIRVVRSA